MGLPQKLASEAAPHTCTLRDSGLVCKASLTYKNSKGTVNSRQSDFTMEQCIVNNVQLCCAHNA